MHRWGVRDWAEAIELLNRRAASVKQGRGQEKAPLCGASPITLCTAGLRDAGQGRLVSSHVLQTAAGVTELEHAEVHS